MPQVVDGEELLADNPPMSVFGGGPVPLDLPESVEPPLVPEARAELVSLSVVLDLKPALLAHRCTTPVPRCWVS
ncbi:hypothetical protein GCM10027445_19280 [Amycolatopsis endophytica]|uniref:Uncharacterized protein n=1 Tax=Amycolatopsis endophytica TaxID=860233 RepID=A0A853BEU8_9PSEU|nr:hypothetical protein [Amycolatopsis endophytica]NYI93181.1 hypothetical protein [Amycolatopsis endophytica]